ncbi:hypothetical protein V6N12_023147 [Hibiscus sabdariffa]|uniref:Uncharacterized protein n=1 Tax=Hibiscus sabdariffa TaxID=183260 RepID=A0ABR2FWU0_9ROSI
MARLPDGITELLHHQKLRMKLLNPSRNSVSSFQTFISVTIFTTLKFFRKTTAFFYILLNVTVIVHHQGCFRKSRLGPLVISFEDKDAAQIQEAVQVLARSSIKAHSLYSTSESTVPLIESEHSRC